MYADVGNHLRVGEGNSQEFEVKVGILHGWTRNSVPCSSSSCFEALSCDLRSGVPLETSMQMISSKLTWRNVSGGSLYGAIGGEDKDHDL